MMIIIVMMIKMMIMIEMMIMMVITSKTIATIIENGPKENGGA